MVGNDDVATGVAFWNWREGEDGFSLRDEALNRSRCHVAAALADEEAVFGFDSQGRFPGGFFEEPGVR